MTSARDREMPANLDLVPWYSDAEDIAARAESTGESQLAYNIASLVWRCVAQARAEEREACAKICDAKRESADGYVLDRPDAEDVSEAQYEAHICNQIAAAIRARSEGECS